MKTKLLLALMVLGLLFAANAYAVPDMQVYIPGGTYVDADQSWHFGSTNFELWFIAANKDLYGVYLTFATGDDNAGSITVNPDGTNDYYTYSTFAHGTPFKTYTIDGEPFTSSLPPHGIYPAYYAEHSLGYIPLGSETVQDMPGSGTADGTILEFNVTSSGLNSLHIDAYGYYFSNSGNPNNKFVPPSHDAQANPEPITLALVGLGAAGLLFRRKR
ncbi:MAG: choice-of-anchor N protein [Candidatus Omnitrophota bacterium]